MCVGYSIEPDANGLLWYLSENGETIWIEEPYTVFGYGQLSITSLGTEFIAITYDLDDNTIIYNFNNSYNILWDNAYPGHQAMGDKSVHIIDSGIIFSNYTGYGGSDNNYINLIKTDSTGQVVDVNDFTIPITDLTLNCYPNPFNPIINLEIKFSNEQNQQNEQMKIEIFNVKGQKIETIPFENKTITWDASGYSSGIYFCKLVNVEDGNILSVKKVTLLK